MYYAYIAEYGIILYIHFLMIHAGLSCLLLWGFFCGKCYSPSVLALTTILFYDSASIMETLQQSSTWFTVDQEIFAINIFSLGLYNNEN